MAFEIKAKHKPLVVRGKIFEGIVVSTKMPKTVTVERTIVHYVSKYQRYKKNRARVKAHVPEGMKVSDGDKVQIGETRKISKTKNFVVMQVLKEKAFMKEEEEAQ